MVLYEYICFLNVSYEYMVIRINYNDLTVLPHWNHG